MEKNDSGLQNDNLKFRCRACNQSTSVGVWLKQEFQCVNKECVLGRRRRRSWVQNTNEVKETAREREISCAVKRSEITFDAIPKGVKSKEIELPTSIHMELK